jgi:hypothetical protein
MIAPFKAITPAAEIVGVIAIKKCATLLLRLNKGECLSQFITDLRERQLICPSSRNDYNITRWGDEHPMSAKELSQ